jgi:beta-galactosidase
VARAEVKHDAPPGVSEALLELIVEHPRLWHGRVDPYLYQVVVEVAEKGRILDRVRQPLGFRSFFVDPERGFLLNGEPYELRGVNLHQDREGKGWAVTREEREEDFRLILELGCTLVRLVHYQHAEHAHDLCDRLGLAAWAEHGLVNTVSESPLFGDRCATELTELIRQSHNHPSIVCWGIGNEVQPHTPAARALLRRLSALVKAEDPTRPSTLATCFDELPGAYGNELLAHNQYFGWYRGEFADFPRWLDAMRARASGAPIGMSEYGAGAGPSLHSDAPRALDHTEEHQCLFHEAYWRALRERPWVWCRAVWQMFDAASDGRSEGEGPGINDKGLVTRDRSIKKDAFFWYQANWTDEPMVYLASRRFTPRTSAKTDVKVYSNCAEVELCLDGRSLGTRPVEDHVARFDGVTLSPGKNRLEAFARTRGIEVRDVCEWVLERE